MKRGRSYDVAVVGGGPSGAMAAHYLATHGVSVALLEKCSLPRTKTCGGGVVRRAMASLPFEVSEAIEAECRSAALILGPAPLSFRIQRESPVISMTTRDRFDFLLVNAARKAGAHIYENFKVTGVRHRRGGVELRSDRGSFIVPFVVGADGATGMVARKAGWRESRRLVPAIEMELRVRDHVYRGFQGAAQFDFRAVPYGYGWVFPKRGHLSVGVLCMRPGHGRPEEAMERFLARKGLHRGSRITRGRASVIPVSPRRGPLVKGRVILTGDAAGLADPLLGEGISSAVRSGIMAGKAVIGGDFHTDRVREIYEEDFLAVTLRELRLARRLAGIVYEHPTVRNILFRLYGRDFAEAVTEVIMGRRTYGRLLSDPLNYLQLLRIRGLGKRRRRHYP